MKKSLLLIMSFILVLVLYACTTSKPQQVTVKENVSEVKVVASCNDDNPCTEDLFNQLTQECEHKRLNYCCGDRTCDANERCDQAKHKTVCPEDCPRECPGELALSNLECSGKCIKSEDKYIVDGDTKFTLQVQNIGELSINDVTSIFRCTKENGNIFVSTTTAKTKSGVSFKDYFNNEEKKISLTGIPYGKDKAKYTLEITGNPEEDVTMFYLTKELRTVFLKEISWLPLKGF